MELRENQIGKVYLEEIDTLKGIAIFLVVLGHSIIYFPIDLHMNSICDFIFRWLSSVHMPLFFVVSGYCYSYGGDYKKYLVKKLKRLLIPYFIFNAIDIVPRYCLSAFVNRPRNLEESVKKIFFDGGEYWFLYVLFFIFVVFPYIDKMTKDSVYRKIVATIIIIGIYYFLPNFGIIKVMIYYCMYFAAGVITKKNTEIKCFPIQ